MKIPSVIIRDTVFYKENPRYCFQLCNYIIPGVKECDETEFEKNKNNKLVKLPLKIENMNKN